jgi:uncharacterized membrane protein YfcA
MSLTLIQYVLGLLSGGVVGFSLGMFGGGGSILAVPLMVYFVGVPNAHLAIGTSAFAVAVNAGTGLVPHAFNGSVKWRCAAIFSVAGVCGALVGSAIGKMVDGQKLLFLFALLMIVVGLLMFRSRQDEGDADAECTRDNAPKVVGYGAVTGALSGFFGIGGGFLIVPGLMASTRMPILNAIGSSLVAVCAFGLTTALSYALSGYVDWPLAITFIVGGVGGARIGFVAAKRTAASKGSLKIAFAVLIFVVAIYMIVRSWSRL